MTPNQETAPIGTAVFPDLMKRLAVFQERVQRLTLPVQMPNAEFTKLKKTDKPNLTMFSTQFSTPKM